MNILTLYYSRSGHTKEVARLIQEAAGGDIAPIRTRRSYSGSYPIAVLQGGWEKMRGALPPLMALPVDLVDYDVIFLGGPVWWFSIAPALKSFLASHDLAGKTVYPFLTSGGQPKDSFKDMEDLIGGRVGEGFHVYFKKDDMQADPEEIRRWAARCAAEAEGEER